MRKILNVVALLLLLWSNASAQPVSESGDSKQLWQLLDYVAVDYSGAVVNGAVVSEGEYAEMLDFIDNAKRQVQQLPAHPSKGAIAVAIEDLRAAVVHKAEAKEVARLAHAANALVIAAYPIPVAPKTLPDLARGAALYSANCASCHGAKGGGDGSLAASLDPKPIAFNDSERAGSRSLMALYQVVTQGVEGTSMASFASLSDEDRWALAFYVGTLSHDNTMRSKGEQVWKTDAEVKRRFPDLAAVTTTTELAASESMPAETARDVTAYLRSHPGVVEAGKPTGLALARQRLKESLAAFHAGDRANATKLGLSAYLDGFEPIEPIVGARNKSLLVAVEDAMLKYRSVIARGNTDEVQGAAALLDRLFAQVDAELGDAQAEPMTTFIGALTILMREGLEALLIVIGMIAFLRKAQRPDVLRHVHAGWISALLSGALTWVIATYLVEISGASREVTEGVGSVFAAVVLLSVGMWMHQKSSAGRWQAYLDAKLSAAVARRSAWALFVLAFIAVYREVFETVLFYSALTADGNAKSLMAGFLTGVALLAVIAWVLLRTSARMPIGKFFSITSVLVAALAVILIGKGVAGLQEAGWVGVHPILTPRIEILGLYPTLETTVAQAVVLALAIAGFALNGRNGRQPKPQKPVDGDN